MVVLIISVMGLLCCIKCYCYVLLFVVWAFFVFLLFWCCLGVIPVYSLFLCVSIVYAMCLYSCVCISCYYCPLLFRDAVVDASLCVVPYLTRGEAFLWGLFLFFYGMAFWGAYEFAYIVPGVHPVWSGTWGPPFPHHYIVGFIGMVPCVYWLTFKYRKT